MSGFSFPVWSNIVFPHHIILLHIKSSSFPVVLHHNRTGLYKKRKTLQIMIREMYEKPCPKKSRTSHFGCVTRRIACLGGVSINAAALKNKTVWCLCCTPPACPLVVGWGVVTIIICASFFTLRNRDMLFLATSIPFFLPHLLFLFMLSGTGLLCKV